MLNNFTIQRKKDIYLSDTDLNILKKYDVNYENYNSMKELLFEIENILNNNYHDDDLEELSIKLSEYNYYFNTNK